MNQLPLFTLSSLHRHIPTPLAIHSVCLQLLALKTEFQSGYEMH